VLISNNEYFYTIGGNIKFTFSVRLLRFMFAALKGTMAEWLGKALQKLLQQFESVWYLKNQRPFQTIEAAFSYYYYYELAKMGWRYGLYYFNCFLLYALGVLSGYTEAFYRV
jgi:hypothetical protein